MSMSMSMSALGGAGGMSMMQEAEALEQVDQLRAEKASLEVVMQQMSVELDEERRKAPSQEQPLPQTLAQLGPGNFAPDRRSLLIAPEVELLRRQLAEEQAARRREAREARRRQGQLETQVQELLEMLAEAYPVVMQQSQVHQSQPTGDTSSVAGESFAASTSAASPAGSDCGVGDGSSLMGQGEIDASTMGSTAPVTGTPSGSTIDGDAGSSVDESLLSFSTLGLSEGDSDCGGEQHGHGSRAGQGGSPAGVALGERLERAIALQYRQQTQTLPGTTADATASAGTATAAIAAAAHEQVVVVDALPASPSLSAASGAIGVAGGGSPFFGAQKGSPFFGHHHLNTAALNSDVDGSGGIAAEGSCEGDSGIGSGFAGLTLAGRGEGTAAADTAAVARLSLHEGSAGWRAESSPTFSLHRYVCTRMP